MEVLLNSVRGWRIGEAGWTALIAAEMFCIDHKFLVGVVCVAVVIVSVWWSCLRRGRPPREKGELEGGIL